MVTSDNGGGDFIEPSLSLGPLYEVPSVLLARLVTLAGAITLDRDRLLSTGLLVHDYARGGALGDAGLASSCADWPTSPKAATASGVGHGRRPLTVDDRAIDWLDPSDDRDLAHALAIGVHRGSDSVMPGEARHARRLWVPSTAWCG
jgi:hypothetical protein